MAGILSPYAVVGTHYAPRTALLHGSFECRQVDLVERTVAQTDVHHMPTILLIVQSKMLDAGGNAVLLHASDVRHNHGG